MLQKQVDPVDINQVYTSKKIKSFVATVTSGEQFAFFDLDGTITSPLFDVEDYAITKHLIPAEKIAEWSQKVDRKQKGDFGYIYFNRHITRSYITSKVTKHLAQITNLPEGSPTTANLLKRVGYYTGKFLIKNSYQSNKAIEVIRTCIRKNIHVVILTATPVDIAEEVLDVLKEKFSLKVPIIVIGSEYAYSPQGKITETLWLRGPNKIYVVEECIKRGGIPVLGAGDNPISDAFIPLCKIQVNIKPQNETSAWHEALKQLNDI